MRRSFAEIIAGDEYSDMRRICAAYGWDIRRVWNEYPNPSGTTMGTLERIELRGRAPLTLDNLIPYKTRLYFRGEIDSTGDPWPAAVSRVIWDRLTE